MVLEHPKNERQSLGIYWAHRFSDAAKKRKKLTYAI
jgi:hypothetical protein